MKLKGIKAAAGELKEAKYARIYVNIQTGEVIAMTYIDSSSFSTFNDESIYEVCRYNYRYNNPTMAWIKEQVEQKLFELGIQ